MTPEEVAKRFAQRPGYDLVDYGVVGLPAYRVTCTALVIEKKKIDPIDEFVLRAIDSGLREAEDVAGFLGLAPSIVDSAIAEFIRRESVAIEGGSLTLTEKGKALAATAEAVRPLEQTLVFHFDGLTRKPVWFGDTPLMLPAELRDAGMPEIRAFPSKGPELAEIEVADVARVIALAIGRFGDRELLHIKNIERRQRAFKDAVALVYRGQADGNIQVAFAVEGRLSEEHELAFARANGPQKMLRLFKAVAEKQETPQLAAAVGDDLAARIPPPEKPKPTSEKPSPPATPQVRPIAVYEHPPLLSDALDKSDRRLVIISPWIRSAVVDSTFVGRLEKALRRGVSVFIGHGIEPTDDPNLAEWDKRALSELERLAKTHKNFVLRRLGDTHAKVLIKDSDYFVITSFNWLSFRGDPNRTFREEWGTMVAMPAVVDEFFEKKLKPRLA